MAQLEAAAHGGEAGAAKQVLALTKELYATKAKVAQLEEAGAAKQVTALTKANEASKAEVANLGAAVTKQKQTIAEMEKEEAVMKQRVAKCHVEFQELQVIVQAIHAEVIREVRKDAELQGEISALRFQLADPRACAVADDMAHASAVKLEDTYKKSEVARRKINALEALLNLDPDDDDDVR